MRRSTIKPQRWLLGSTALVLALLPAAAQAAEPAAEISEIIVTAQRREQALTDVGLSVSVLSAEAITDRQIASAADLARIVPGFSAADSSLNVPIYSLRGVGFNDASLGSNATVGVYVDEVPLPYPAMSQGAVLDLERIEVLKGPQGTLYGQNSTAGTINYVAAKPSDELEAGVELGFARFNTLTASGYVGGPLSDTVRVRLSAKATVGDEWQRSITRADELGETNRGAARLLVDWTPSDRLTVNLNLNGWYDRSDFQALQLVGFTPARPANIPRLPQVFNSPFAPNKARAADWTPGLDYGRDDRFLQAALRARWALNDDVQVTSISAYSDYKTHGLLDRDGMTPVNFELELTGRIKSFYQELRLSGDHGPVTWSLGANYRNDDVEDLQDTSIREGTSIVNAYRRTPVIGNQDVETYAAFADGEFRVNDAWSVVGGVRYTKDKRDWEGCTSDSGAGDLSAFFSPIINVLRGARGLGPLPPVPPGQCVTLDEQLNPGLLHKSLHEDNVSWHGGVNWKPLARTLVYASLSKGYKAGAFATIGSTTEVQNRPVTQEQLLAYEVGFKTSLLENAAQVNGALFYYDYKNKQQRGRIIDPTFGSLSTQVNVPKSRVKGGEVEAVWHPVRPLTLYASYLYLDTEIREFVGINFASQREDFAGQSLNFSSKHSVNAGVSYERELAEGLTGFVGADLSYRSQTSAFFGNVPGQEIDGYTLLDLRAGLQAPDERWRLSVWGANVTNTYYWNNVVRGTDGIARSAGRPATYGVTFAYRR